MNIKKHYSKSFWKSLPNKSYFKLLLAIFFLFSTLGFITNLFSGAKQTYLFLSLNVILSGILGALYVHGAVKNWKIFPLTLFLHLFIIYLLSSNAIYIENNFDIETQLIVIGIGLLISIILAYVFFIIFITGEGIPQVRLKTEMDLAKQMHEVLVPDILIDETKYSICGKSNPVSEVGGDLIDVYLKNNNLLCYIADVSGHGVSAGLLMGMFKSSIHTSLQENKSLSQIIDSSNNALKPLKKKNMFLTTSLIKFKEDNSAEYLVAGHLPILHYKSDSNSIEELHIKQIPISVKSDYKFETDIVIYKRNDLFILLSDGITEVFDKKKIEFGLSSIKDIIIKNIQLTPNDLLVLIITEAGKHGKQIDDQTLMIIKCN